MLAAVGLWGAIWTVVPWSAALVALRTALGLRWVPVGLLALAGLIGTVAGGLFMVATHGNYSSLGQDPSVLLGGVVAGYLFLGLVAHRLGMLSAKSLRHMASQFAVIWMFGLPTTAWLGYVILGYQFDWAKHVGIVSLLVTPPAVGLAALQVPNRIQSWAGRRISSPMLVKGLSLFSVGMAVGLLVLLALSIVNELFSTTEYIRIAAFLIITVPVAWLIAAALERLAMRREGVTPLTLTRDTRSPPFALAVFALACSFAYPSGLIPMLGRDLDLSACLIPLGAWLGHRYGRRGLYMLAAGALPVLLGLTLAHGIRSGDQGLYFVALIVCRLCYDTDLLKRYLVASVLTPAHIALLFLGLTAVIEAQLSGILFHFSLGTLYYFTFFALGLSAVDRHTRVRTFALILAGFFVLRLIGAHSTRAPAAHLSVLGVGDLDSIIYALFVYHLGRLLRLALLCGGRPERFLCAATGRMERRIAILAGLGMASAELTLNWSVVPRDPNPAASLSLFPPMLVGLAWGFLAFMAATRPLEFVGGHGLWWSLSSGPPAYVRSLRPMRLLRPRGLALCAVLMAILFYRGLAPAPGDGLRFALGVFDLEVTTVYVSITTYLTLAVFFYFGARLGKAGLPDLSSLPRYRARPAARPVPHLDLGWLGRLLTLWGALAMILGLFAAGVDWVDYFSASDISQERKMK